MANQKPLSEHLREFFATVRNKRLWIQTHNFPDPDALASAEAFRVIARYFGIHAKIISNVLPQRSENTALIKECSIAVNRLDAVKIKSPKKTAWVFIDCVPGGGNVTLHPIAPTTIFFAIDHHESPVSPFRGETGSYMHIDKTAGATATILTELLLDFDIPISQRLASALSYGIITDTQDFSRGATKRDLDSYSAIFPLANQKILSRIRNAAKPRDYFRIIHQALENAFVYRRVAWAITGEVPSGESVAEIADFLLTCERVSWSLAMGYTTDRLFLSLRSSKPNAQCGKIIRKLVPSPMGAVGGHDRLAGGFILFDSLSESEPEKIADAFIQRFIRIVLRLPKSAENPTGTPLIGKKDNDKG